MVITNITTRVIQVLNWAFCSSYRYISATSGFYIFHIFVVGADATDLCINVCKMFHHQARWSAVFHFMNGVTFLSEHVWILRDKTQSCLLFVLPCAVMSCLNNVRRSTAGHLQSNSGGPAAAPPQRESSLENWMYLFVIIICF